MWAALASIVADLGGKAIGAVSNGAKRADQARKAVAERLAERAAWLVGLVFLIWAGPLVHGYIDPEAAGRLADVLSAYPEWYVKGFRRMSEIAAGGGLVMKLVGRR